MVASHAARVRASASSDPLDRILRKVTCSDLAMVLSSCPKWVSELGANVLAAVCGTARSALPYRSSKALAIDSAHIFSTALSTQRRATERGADLARVKIGGSCPVIPPEELRLVCQD
jgi:hypothetical protein